MRKPQGNRLTVFWEREKEIGMSYKHRILIAALLGCLPLSGMAAEQPSPFGWSYGDASQRRIGPVADSSREERARFRSQLQQLPAGEREAVMRELRQQWQEVPPEERYKQREDWMKRNRDRHDPDQGQDAKRKKQPWEEGYGQGYESRQWERPDASSPFERPENARPFERPDFDAGGRGRR
jgi:hypothetical protein